VCGLQMRLFSLLSLFSLCFSQELRLCRRVPGAGGGVESSCCITRASCCTAEREREGERERALLCLEREESGEGWISLSLGPGGMLRLLARQTGTGTDVIHYRASLEHTSACEGGECEEKRSEELEATLSFLSPPSASSRQDGSSVPTKQSISQTDARTGSPPPVRSPKRLTARSFERR